MVKEISELFSFFLCLFFPAYAPFPWISRNDHLKDINALLIVSEHPLQLRRIARLIVKQSNPPWNIEIFIQFCVFLNMFPDGPSKLSGFLSFSVTSFELFHPFPVFGYASRDLNIFYKQPKRESQRYSRAAGARAGLRGGGQRGPLWWNLFVSIKYSFEKFLWIRKRYKNTTLYYIPMSR